VLGRISLLACVLGVAVVGCGDSGGATGGGNADMAISFTSSFNATVIVGQLADFDLTIVNVGKADIPNLGVMFDDGDRFLDHYTVVSSGSCTVDKDLPGLACGSLAHGTALKFTMTAQPRNAGNFTFKFHIANGGRYLNEATGQGFTYFWQQAILT
jgi:hypothetical protein